MQNFTYTVTDPMGLHARPAGLLVKEARKYQSEIILSLGEKSVQANRLMALMSMGCKCGDMLSVSVSGEDEEKAARELAEFFRQNL